MWFAVGFVNELCKEAVKMPRLPIVSWIENAAAVLTGGWGAFPDRRRPLVVVGKPPTIMRRKSRRPWNCSGLMVA